MFKLLYGQCIVRDDHMGLYGGGEEVNEFFT
jgi:hypothetical protein